MTSTGYDSILAFDIEKQCFNWAMHVETDGLRFHGRVYDPDTDDGPLQINKLHLNSVTAGDGGMDLAGLKTGGMLHFNGKAINMSANLFPTDKLTGTDFDDSRIARPSFGRGLCVVRDRVIAAGSSPSTIALHDLDSGKTALTVTLSSDVRNAIHGLEVWPFS